MRLPPPPSFIAKRLPSLLAAPLLSLLFIPGASGATLSEPFQTPLDEEQWKIARRTGTSAIVTVSSWDGGTNYGLLISRPASGDGGSSNSNAAVFYTGTMEGINEGIVSNFSGSVTLTLSAGAIRTDSSRGIALRAQATSYAYSGYYLAFSHNKLFLSQDPSAPGVNGLELASSTLQSTLQNGQTYRLDFSIIGNSVEASLFWGDTLLGSLIHDLSINGEPFYTEGYFGLRGAYQGEVSSFFSQLTVTPIPEPNALLFLSFGVVGLPLLRKVTVNRRF